MDEGERLRKLVEDLMVASSRHESMKISEKDAGHIATALHEEMDEGTRAREQHARRDKRTIACKRGCNACCTELIVVFEPESLAVAQWLQRPENERARSNFLRNYPQWDHKVGNRTRRLSEAEAAGGMDRFQELLAEVHREQIMCAFNREGACEIYPVRPNVCRVAHALETSEHCCADSTADPTYFHFEPIDRLMKKTRPLTYAAHVGVRGAGLGPSALCERVYALLTREGASAATEPES